MQENARTADSLAALAIDRGDPGYEQARQELVAQARVPERLPDRIVRVRAAGEVASQVRAAVARGDRVAARGSGHNYQGNPLRDGGLLLDLSELNEVAVDPRSQTAWVGPGARGGDLAAALDAHGLGFPGPHDARVGVGGFLLAGGMGLNLGQWGPACLRIRAVEAVTATGDEVRADAAHLPELLSAARGGGPAFPGIVTRFELELCHGARDMREIVFRMPIARTPEVAPLLDEIAAEMGRRVEFVVMFIPSGSGGFDLLVRGWFWGESAADAEALAAPFARLGEPTRRAAFASLGEWYAEYATHHERQELRRAADNFWVDDPIATWLPEVAEIMSRAPSPTSQLLMLAAPSWNRLALDPNAAVFSKVGTWFAEPAAAWLHEGDDEANIAWLRELSAPIARRSHGHYIASVDSLADPDRNARCFDPEQWTRLRAIVDAHDPHGIFHDVLAP